MQPNKTRELFKNVERYFYSRETTDSEEDQLYQQLCELKIPTVYFKNKPTKTNNNRHEIIKFYKRYYKPTLALTLFEYFLVAYSKNHIDVENCKKAIDDANDRCRLIEPGTMVGVIAAQSVSERFTQSCLRTFHLSGTKASAVTGVKRIMEIFDAIKNLEMPLLGKCTKNPRAKYLKEFTDEYSLLYIDGFYWLKLGIDLEPFSNSSCVKFKRFLKNTTSYCCQKRAYKLKAKTRDDAVKIMHYIDEARLAGLADCVDFSEEDGMAIFAPKTNSSSQKIDFAEMYEVAGIEDLRKFSTNDIFYTANLLGIEAARESALIQIKEVLNQEGIHVAFRHLSLIIDAMTWSGKFRGNTYNNLDFEQGGVILKATFEQATKTFRKAACEALVDELNCTSSSLIVGREVEIGAAYGHDILELQVKPRVSENFVEYYEQQEEPEEDVIDDDGPVYIPASPEAMSEAMPMEIDEEVNFDNLLLRCYKIFFTVTFNLNKTK